MQVHSQRMSLKVQALLLQEWGVFHPQAEVLLGYGVLCASLSSRFYLNPALLGACAVDIKAQQVNVAKDTTDKQQDVGS